MGLGRVCIAHWCATSNCRRLMFDFENDGDKDMAMVSGFHNFWAQGAMTLDLCNNTIFKCSGYALNRITLYQNTNHSITQPWREIAYERGLSYRNYNLREDSRALVPIDFDNDGDIDLLEVVMERGLVLHQQFSPPENKWLKISLRGTQSNSFGLGAEITVYNSDVGHQYFIMSSPQTYVCSSSFIAHFGFGPGNNSANVSVYWPVSHRRIDYALALNQHVTLSEDDACVNTNCATGADPCENIFCWATIDRSECCSSETVCIESRFMEPCNRTEPDTWNIFNITRERVCTSSSATSTPQTPTPVQTNSIQSVSQTRSSSANSYGICPSGFIISFEISIRW
jgi:hypothetical protein